MSFPTKKKRGGKNASRAELDAITLPHHKNKKLIDDDDGSVLLHLLTRLSVRQPSKMIKKRTEALIMRRWRQPRRQTTTTILITVLKRFIQQE
jgi:hypothetical protein